MKFLSLRLDFCFMMVMDDRRFLKSVNRNLGVFEFFLNFKFDTNWHAPFQMIYALCSAPV